MARARDSGTIIAGFERISFIESLSSRFELPPRLVVYGIGGAAAILIALVCWMSFSGAASPVKEAVEPQTHSSLERPPTEFYNAEPSPVADTVVASAPQAFVVYVTGAVVNPGLYSLAGNGRVGDAVQAAGGLTPEAASAVVNQAQPLADGMQIHIPRLDEVQNDAPTAAAPQPGNTATTGPEAPALVNINTADSATLQTLNGIGPATAQKIIDYRTAHGPFSTKEELRQVSGIGEKKYAAIEARITV